MKLLNLRGVFVLAAFTSVMLTGVCGETRPPERLVWLDTPAKLFTESSPLGNGRLGAMVFGGVSEERIVLNESGMWSGGPQDADRADAAEALPEIRRLLLAGKNAEAEALVNQRFTCAGKGSGFGRGANVPYGSYQLLGDLRLKFLHAGVESAATNYRRELDLNEAVVRVSYVQSGVTFTREIFASAPDEILAIKLTADRPGMLSLDVALSRSEGASVATVGAGELLLSGQLNNGTDGQGVRYAAQVRATAQGGTTEVSAGVLHIRAADEVVLYLGAATDIRSFAGRKVADAKAAAADDVTKATAKNYAELRRAHVADYRRWFARTELRIGDSDTASKLSAPARLQAFAAGADDPGLAALYFDFGRYLLISSSRPGGFPANLQGIWADSINTPWNGDWHLNINVQMNYWPAEVCNLSELHAPLFALIGSLQEPGARTAQKYYSARGWVAHVLANPWGYTSPGESASWGATTTGSAWLCQHLWEHYLFTGDQEFLARVYPMMKGSALFYLDMLIDDPQHGLVVAPSHSPENAYLLPDGKKGHICLGATFDTQVIRALFGWCIEAQRVLGVDAELGKELAAKRARLPATSIATDGRVKEWLEEYREDDPHHRHVSHLWGLFPGDEISPRATPALAQAARKTLDARGDGGTGWSLAFKLGMWARLHDGERAFRILQAHLKPAVKSSDGKLWTGGTYPNFFDAHPPFQIDGNLGGAAVIAELLLQSRLVFVEAGRSRAEIELLPALPSKWSEGAVRGLKARGGYEVSFSWRNGRVEYVAIRATSAGELTITAGGKTTHYTLEAGQELHLDESLRRTW